MHKICNPLSLYGGSANNYKGDIEMVVEQFAVILVVALAILALYVFTQKPKVGRRSFATRPTAYKTIGAAKPKARKVVKKTKARKTVAKKVKK